MIKIAFVINNIKNNGPGKVVINLIKGLDKSKYKIFLITLFKGNDKHLINNLEKEKIIIKELNNKHRINFLLFNHKNIKKYLKKEKINIVHSHGIIPDYVISKIRLKIKKISTIHCNMFEDYNSYGKIKKVMMVYLHLKTLKKFNKCICCSQSVYNEMKNDLKNCTYAINGVDIQNENNKKINKKILNIPNDATVYIYAGVLKKGKGVKKLLQMFIKSSSEKDYLIILGNGEEYDECIKISKDYKNIKILGFKDNAIDYFKISDVYCSNSKSEGMSISIIEALSNGLYLLVSDIPSHSETLNFDKKYYIGEKFNNENFDEKFNKIKNNIATKNKEKIIEYQQKYLSSKSMSNSYDLIYSKIMENTNG